MDRIILANQLIIMEMLKMLYLRIAEGQHQESEISLIIKLNTGITIVRDILGVEE
jgi:hypothetical protein